MDQHREAEIVRGLRRGDADAWRALYDAFVEEIWWFVARRLAPSGQDVADVVQETFLAAAAAARQFDPDRGNLGGWLAGVARHHVALYYRKQQRQDQVRLQAESWGANCQHVVRWLENREPEPAEVLHSREMALLIRNALSTLTSDYEQLLTWKYLDGEAVDLIAQRLGASETAVRSKLARARRAFREAFRACVTCDSLSEQQKE